MWSHTKSGAVGHSSNKIEVYQFVLQICLSGLCDGSYPWELVMVPIL